MASLADQISKLISPAPVFHDPEDVADESGAKVLEKDPAEEDPDTATVKHSKLRKANVTLLADEDSRYAGKRITRKTLEVSRTGSTKGFKHSEGEDEETSDDDYDNDTGSDEMDDDEDEGESDNMDESSEEDDELKAFKNKMKQTKHKDQKQKSLTSDKDTDSEDYGGSDDFEDDDSQSDADMEEDGDEDESEDEEAEEESEIEDDTEDEEGGVQNFSKSNIEDEKQKGEAVRCQLGFYDGLLKGRIEVQKVLSAVNQLPQPETWNEFIDAADETYMQGVNEAQNSLHQLLSQILEFQTVLHLQNSETAFMEGESSTETKKQQEKDDDEITSESELEESENEDKPKEGKEQLTSRKRKIRHNQVPELLAKRHKSFKSYRNEIIQKWYDKTRIASGKLGKGFSAFEQSALKQIDQIMSDKERLIKRTQLKRSGYRILGKPEEEEEDEEEQRQRELEGTTKARDTKSYDEEIFDDDDFYHQLLRELIERKTSDINDPIALSRQWLEIQKLRNKVKKKVDTKASKGRKIRYHIHPRLVNFMAPVAMDSWNDEAKDDLFSSLFGQKKKSATEQQS